MLYDKGGEVMGGWQDSITVLKGVGASSAEKFAQLNIYTIRDLLFHFPFRYEDLQLRPLETLLDQDKVTLKGKVVSEPVVSFFGKKKNRLSFRMGLETGEVIQVVFFNQAYLKQHIVLGEEEMIIGKWQAQRQTLLAMKRVPISHQSESLAVYPSVKGLKQNFIIQLIRQALQIYKDIIPDPIPNYLNQKYRLVSLADALEMIHCSDEAEDKKQAKRKIIFLEFFMYQWHLKQLAQRQETRGIKIEYDVTQLRHIIQQLPFELTNAQKQAVNTICKDLISPQPMRRLLQGDVGSGKTLVAFLSMIAAAQSGYQSALMVPTEILAKQHVAAFNRLFSMFGLHAELLISGLKNKEKNRILETLQNGTCTFVIGTHALIQESVNFNRLGLVVIDEQHRFGVNQRQALLDKSQVTANLLQMTATPIPRSLAMTVYADMAVSTIDELPSNRQPITTIQVNPSQLSIVYERMIEQLEAGHQIYYVLPLIDTSESLADVDNVLEIAQTLQQLFSDYRTDVLHGQLDRVQQETVMEDFIHNRIQILVATTMVEVGVDVANATVIVIQSAERFGLAQLHQLRGRVGRSELKSYCYLVANPTTEQGKSRLNIMTSSQDGFYISQEDLKIRGMGDIFGKMQSGLPQFYLANLIEDEHILRVAREEVNQLVHDTTHITENERAQLIQWSQNYFVSI